jgi:hypothetical protein
MLAEDAQVQVPELPWLPAALSNCGPGRWESCAYVRYVSPVNSSQPDSQWHFETNVVIDHSVLGMVVIDILQGNRIGGIEFIDRIEC